MSLIIIKNLNTNQIDIICSDNKSTVRSVEIWQDKNDNPSILWKISESNNLIDAIKESKKL